MKKKLSLGQGSCVILKIRLSDPLPRKIDALEPKQQKTTII